MRTRRSCPSRFTSTKRPPFSTEPTSPSHATSPFMSGMTRTRDRKKRSSSPFATRPNGYSASRSPRSTAGASEVSADALEFDCGLSREGLPCTDSVSPAVREVLPAPLHAPLSSGCAVTSQSRAQALVEPRPGCSRNVLHLHRVESCTHGHGSSLGLGHACPLPLSRSHVRRGLRLRRDRRARHRLRNLRPHRRGKPIPLHAMHVVAHRLRHARPSLARQFWAG